MARTKKSEKAQKTDALEDLVRERTERLEFATRQLYALNEVSIHFTKIYNEDELLEEVPQLATRTLEFDRASLLLEVDGQLKLRSYSMLRDTPELIDNFRKRFVTGTAILPPAFQESFESDEIVFIPDLNNDPRWPKVDGEVIRTKAVVIAPIRVEKKPIGILVGNMQHHERSMDEGDVVRFEMFANMVGLALENVRAYQNLERKVIERTRELRDTNRAMKDKAHSLEKATYSLANANVQLLAVQEQLEKKNSEIEAILDSALSGILMINSDAVVSAANKRIQYLFDIPPSEILNQPISTFTERLSSRFKNPEDFERHREELELDPHVSLSRDFVEVYDKSFELSHPREAVIASVPEPVVDADGDVIGRVWIYTDITQLKKADYQLRQIIEAAPVPLIVSRLEDGKVLFVNENMANLFGVRRDDAINMTTPDFYFDLEDRKRVFEHLALHGSVHNYELRMKKADGSLIWAMVSVQQSEMGGAPVIIGGINDITERKKAEEALRESELRFRSLVENANDIIYSLTPEGVFSYVSPQWTEILGHEVHDIVGKTFHSFVHPEDLPKCVDYFLKIMFFGERQGSLEYRIQHMDGSWRWHVTNASVMRDKKNEIVSFIGICHDVTMTRKFTNDLADAYRTLKETQSQLVQSEKMASLGMLVAGIAHEINTPISAINSMHDTLVKGVRKMRDTVKKEVPEALESPRMKAIDCIIEDADRVIGSACDRVTNIVKRLRSFARLDEAELKKVDIHEGLEDTLTLIHHELKHSVQVHRNYGDIPQIACYPGRLNQVFLNMLINAKQAMNDKGEITISTYKKDGKVHVAISDTGVGIAPENISRLFDPGFTTKNVGVGTGLGLSICYQIIEDHKGEILVDSEVGKGTTFTIVLPMNLETQ